MEEDRLKLWRKMDCSYGGSRIVVMEEDGL